jgi:hypothetical protein
MVDGLLYLSDYLETLVGKEWDSSEEPLWEELSAAAAYEDCQLKVLWTLWGTATAQTQDGECNCQWERTWGL